MAQVSLSPQVKEQLEEIKNNDGHTSLDSVVRTLLERAQLAEDYQKFIHTDTPPRSIDNTTTHSDDTQPVSTNESVITNKVVTVVEQLPLESKIVLLSVLNLDKGNNGNFITEQNVFSTARLVCLEIDMETIPQSRVSELIVELDMLGLIAAEVSVQGDDKKVLDAEITANVDDIHHGLSNTPFSHLDFHRPIDTQTTTM